MRSQAAAERRKLRRTEKWKQLSKSILKHGPSCSVCGQPATAVDHIQHDDSNVRFFDRSNLRPICLPCNSRKSVKEADLDRYRRGGRREGGRSLNSEGDARPHPKGTFFTQANRHVFGDAMAEAIRRRRAKGESS